MKYCQPFQEQVIKIFQNDSQIEHAYEYHQYLFFLTQILIVKCKKVILGGSKQIKYHQSILIVKDLYDVRA